MSTEIDEKVVQMRFDNKNFESNVQTSLSTLGKLKQSLNFSGSSKSLENVSNAAKNVNMSPLSNAVETVQAKFSALQVIGMTALANITNSAINTGKRMLSALTIDPIKTGFQEYETQMNSVQTILANTQSKGSTLQDVNNALSELNTYADKTIYNFTEMTRNIGTFTAAGVDLKTSVSSIKGIANLAAVSGSTSQQASTAMYQLSQALAAGKVSLMDWNSVVNAGMGGEVFQNALKRTATHMGKDVDGLIKKFGSFRESLTEGEWLTTEVLTETLTQLSGAYTEADLIAKGYTQEQAKQITDLANTAVSAATEVKTFTQLWDTLKESAQSGWTKTWEILVGDFEEAKTMLTGVSNTIGGFIEGMSEARNNLLEGAFSTGWKQLMSEGITDAEYFQDIMTTVAKEHGVNLSEMENGQKTFQQSLKDGWLTVDILSESMGKYGEKLKSMSEEELKAAGYTLDDAKAFQELEEKISNGTLSMEQFVTAINRASGRELAIQGITNVFKGLGEIIKPVKEAFREIIPSVTSEQLYNFITRFTQLTEKFKISESVSERLKRTFKGVFSVIKIGIDLFGTLCKVIAPVAKIALTVADALLSITAVIGDYLTAAGEAITKTNFFGQAFEALGSIVGPVINFLKKGFNVIRDVFNSFGTFELGDVGGISGAVEKIFAPFDAIGNFIKTVLDKLSNVLSEGAKMIVGGFTIVKTALTEGMSGSAFGKIADIAKKAFGGLSKVLISVGEYVGKAFDILKDVFTSGLQSPVFGNLLSLINGGLLTSIMFGFKGLVDFIKETFESGGGILDGISDTFEGITDALDGVRGCLESYQQNLKADMLIKISIAIGILAASLIAIASIDPGRLDSSLTAIAVMMGELMGSLFIFEKVAGSKKFGNLGKVTTNMIKMAIAIKILAGAMVKLSDLEWEQIGKGLTAVAGLCAILVGAAAGLGKVGGKMTKTSIGLIIFSAAIALLGNSLETLGKLPLEQIGKGLLALGGMLAIVAGALHLMPKNITGKAVGLTILSAAMIIMAQALKSFGNIPLENIGLGLLGMAGSLAIIAGALHLIPKNTLTKSISLTVLAAALLIIAEALKSFSGIPLDKMGNGLIGMAGAMTIITGALNLMPKNIFTTAVSLTVLAAALLIIAESLKSFSSIPLETMTNGLMGMAGAMTIIVGALHLMPKNIFTTAVSLTVLGAALIIMAEALKGFSSIPLAETGIGLLGMAGALAVIVGALHLMPKNILVSAVGLTVVAAALIILADALKTMGGMSMNEMGISLSTLIISLGALAAAVNLMNGALMGAAAILVVSAALAVLAPVLVQLGSLSWEEVAISLVTLAGAFAIIGVAGLVLAPLVPVIALLGGAIALLGIGCAAVGGGVLALSAGLAALAVSGAAGGQVLIQLFVELINLLPLLIQKLGEAVVLMAQAIIEGAPVLLEAFTVLVVGLVDALVACIPKVVEGIGILLVEILATIVKYLPNIVQAGFDIIMALLEGIANNIGKIVGAAIDIVVNFINGIAEKLPDIINAAFNLVVTFITGLADAVEQNAPIIVDAIDRLMNAIVDAALLFLENSVDLFKKVGSKIMNSGFVQGIKDKISAGISAVKEFVTNLVNTIKSFISKFLSAGKELLTNLINGVKSKVSSAVEAVKSVPSKCISALKGFVSKFVSAGKDLISGLVSGITSKVSSAIKSVKNMASKLISAAKGVFGINSPSKVFAEMGRYLDEGLVVGITKYAKLATNAAKDVGTDMIDVMNKSISALATENMNTQPTIRPVIDLTDVENGVNSMNGLFANSQAVSFGLSGNANINAVTAMMRNSRFTATNDDVVSAINDLKKTVNNATGDSYSINGVTYDDGSNISEAVKSIVRAARVERRI